jgi:hypothetical protein
MNKLLKDAIADAKAVRETALANAKLALEEAFAPKIQSMLSHKIKEDMGGEDEPMEEDEEIVMSDEMGSEEGEEKMESRRFRNSGLYEEDEDEMPADDMSDEAPEEAPAEESDEDAGVSDEELAEILRELEGDEEEMASEGDDYSEDPEALMEEDDDDDDDEEEAPKTEARRKKKKMMENEEDGKSKEDKEEISIEEIIRALREEDGEEEMKSEGEDGEDSEEMKKDLEEAYKVIKFLRSKLNEVNLLNAKLLYVNKLFKKANLTEGKKMRVIETFDRVKSVREAKLVYATLCESLTAAATKKPINSGRTSLKEGFASRASKGTRVINESNQLVNRFKELVNYNKNNY